jgi:hypothetical protein
MIKIRQLGIVSGVALAALVTAGAAQAACFGGSPSICLNLNLESSASPLSNNSALTTAGFGFSHTITWKAISSTQTVDARDNTGNNPSYQDRRDLTKKK